MVGAAHAWRAAESYGLRSTRATGPTQLPRHATDAYSGLRLPDDARTVDAADAGTKPLVPDATERATRQGTHVAATVVPRADAIPNDELEPAELSNGPAASHVSGLARHETATVDATADT